MFLLRLWLSHFYFIFIFEISPCSPLPSYLFRFLCTFSSVSLSFSLFSLLFMLALLIFISFSFLLSFSSSLPSPLFNVSYFIIPFSSSFAAAKIIRFFPLCFPPLFVQRPAFPSVFPLECRLRCRLFHPASKKLGENCVHDFSIYLPEAQGVRDASLTLSCNVIVCCVWSRIKIILYKISTDFYFSFNILPWEMNIYYTKDIIVRANTKPLVYIFI